MSLLTFSYSSRYDRTVSGRQSTSNPLRTESRRYDFGRLPTGTESTGALEVSSRPTLCCTAQTRK